MCIRDSGIARDWMSFGRLDKSIVHLGWATEDAVCCIGRESKDEDNDNDHDGVDVVGQERGLDTPKHGIKNDSDGQQEASGCGRDASKTGHDSATTCEEHCCDQNVGHDTEGDVDTMGSATVACSYDFEKCVCIRCSALEFDGQSREQDDLDGGSRCIPKRARDSILVCDRRRLKYCGPFSRLRMTVLLSA